MIKLPKTLAAQDPTIFSAQIGNNLRRKSQESKKNVISEAFVIITCSHGHVENQGDSQITP
jgi:hypothetical protein